MKHLRTYEGFALGLPSVSARDRRNFLLIFNSLYESHLTLNERLTIESTFGMVNESWFSDLVEKGKRKVLKVKSEAGELLVNLATKAKDILDFAKQLAGQIGEYVKKQFEVLKEKIKGYALKSVDFLKVLLEFFEKKKTEKLRNYVSGTADLIQYVASGKLISDIVTRLSEAFSKVFNLGTNEGISHLEDEFLFEADDAGEKKSFLQRLGEKVMSMPPFSWIPKIDELMRKGISFLARVVDKFFGWLTTGKDSILGSRFAKSINFLFQILELYLLYKVSGNIEEFKKKLEKKSGLEDLNKAIDGEKEQALSYVWQSCGFDPDEIANSVKNAVKKIPYIGDILSVLDTLVISVGVYLAVEPTLKRLTT